MWRTPLVYGARRQFRPLRKVAPAPAHMAAPPTPSPRQSEHPEEAWKFIEFALFNEDNKIFEWEVNNLIPPVLSHLE